MQEERILYHEKGLRLAYGRFEKPDTTRQQLHMHPSCEILFLTQVKGVFHVDGSEYPVKPGDFVIIQPGETHYMELDPSVPYDRTVLRFSPALFDSMDPERTLLRPFFDRQSGKRNLYRPTKYGHSDWAPYIKSMLSDHTRNNILIKLLNLLQQINLYFSQPYPDVAKETLEYRIIQYINEHPQENFTTQALCAKFFISRTQLYQRFIKATGTSVGKYIATRRMLTAQQLITQGGKPTEIFTQCGFRDYSTFYRAYVKYFGYSPTREQGEKRSTAVIGDAQET